MNTKYIAVSVIVIGGLYSNYHFVSAFFNSPLTLMVSGL